MTTTMEPQHRPRPVLRHSNTLDRCGFLEPAPEPVKRTRPVLRHSNNLHCGNFLEQYVSDLNRDEKENSGRRLKRSKSADDEQTLRNRFWLDHTFPEDQVLGRIVTEKHEWGEFHRLLKEKRSHCSTHASIQQCINKLVEDQGRKMEEKGDKPEFDASPKEEAPSAEDPQQRVYQIYRQAVILARSHRKPGHKAQADAVVNSVNCCTN